jgi:hypothetical protein
MVIETGRNTITLKRRYTTMTNRYIISGAAPGYETPYYLLLISEADAARLRELASSIEFPKSEDLEVEYVLFRSNQISISVVPLLDGLSWQEDIRSLLGDTIADAIEASMDEEDNHAYTVLDLDELSEEDQAKFKSILEEHRPHKYDYRFYVNSRGGVGVLYSDDSPEEPFYTFLYVTYATRAQ